MTLHEWIKAERKAGRRCTQALLAERLGIHPVTLNKLMNGKLEARVSFVRKIIRMTGGHVGVDDWPEAA